MSWALVIGINDYAIASPLEYACNDADSVAEVLSSKLGFPKEQITVLKNEAATKQSILDSFHNLRDKASNPDDRVLLFYAGHGWTLQGIQGNNIGFLVPVDGDTDKTNSLIRWNDLTQIADLILAKHILFIMDACYSGLAMPRTIAPGSRRFLTEMLQRLARQVITAGKADQVVADGGGPDGRNSLFTGYLLDGLQGDAVDSNGVLTANGLMHYVYTRVSQDSRSQQTPHYGHIMGDGDFILSSPDNNHLVSDSLLDVSVITSPDLPEQVDIKPTFAERLRYSDPTSPNFGRNQWTEKLGETHTGNTYEYSKAFSWVSFIIEPTMSQRIEIDIAEQASILPTPDPNNAQPHHQLTLPRRAITTLDSVILYGQSHQSDFWSRYFRLDKTGNIEYVISDKLIFLSMQDRRTLQAYRCFSFVDLIGTLWQFIFVAKHLLHKQGYDGSVRLLVNLVGTRETILYNFSEELGKDGNKWAPMLGSHPFGPNPENLQCHDLNLQIPQSFTLSKLNEPEDFQIIKHVAQQLSLAYNHQSLPRCFNYMTDVFPWGQYFRYAGNISSGER